jgi:hypothetical protein
MSDPIPDAGNCWNCGEPIITCPGGQRCGVPDACQGFMHADQFHGCPPGISPGSVAEPGEARP